ncbi:MAG TPA: cyclic nucleotide-binding domain-containing protein [Polyangiaceae bacterium]|nr:cyclic nucleotide-binding domain-containing protein [Polyangiaceae bacterium]
MDEERVGRIGREMFLAALGMPLDDVPTWVLDRMTSILEEQDIKAGQALFTAGESVEFLYFMRDGAVRYTREGGPSWTLQGRWVIGAFEALGDRPATHTATAVGGFRGMRVPAAAWNEMLEDSFQLARSAVVNASRALMRVEERIPTGAPESRRETATLPSIPPGTLSLVERLALLLDVRMLRSAGVQALADLAAASRQVSFAAGEAILPRGVGGEELLRVVDGEVLADREGPAMVRRYGPGDLVCGAAILGRVAEPWQALATAPTRVIAFPVEAFFDLMEEHFDLVRSTLSALGARRALLLEHLAADAGELVLT